MKHLSEDQIKAIKTWAKNAKETSEQLNVVLNGIKRQLSKDTESNAVAKLINANWNDFKGLFMYQMPHVVWNGTKTVVPCDWVEAKENSKLDKAIRAYRYGENAVKLDVCVGHIEGDVEKTVMELITFKSGFTKEVPSLDENGEQIKQTVRVKLVPREKTAWGYTETVINAFIAATDELLAELAEA